MIISPDTRRENRVPPGQRLTEGWPILHEGQVPLWEESDWTLRIFGLVEKNMTLDFKEFMSLPRVEVFSDIHCVTGWSKLDNTWEGVSSGAIKDVVKILPEAKFVTVHCYGEYTTNLTIEDFFGEDVLFALRHNGEPVSPERGHPVRLIVPRLYLWKSAKWVDGLEFMARDKPGFWETRGYHNRGDPWKEERYSK
ncbi:MAG: sulfite oxidase-like oxidoreductase [Deltaproteobacteria bacterium]|nr:MAG: sulfite oxidase-like oxidoreductase [Deltaproteobacteria bacterium]